MKTTEPQWERLIHVFTERNAKINLSAIRTPEGVYQKHILDALEIMNCYDLEKFSGKQACDVGTGGGFPLLPLSIQYPDIHRAGIDGRRKKIDAINDMCKQLQITNCTGIHTRIEEHKKKYDLVTARAVAHAKTLLPWINYILKPGGICILYKLYTASEDAAIRKYGRKVTLTHRYNLPEDDVIRCIYVLKK